MRITVHRSCADANDWAEIIGEKTVGGKTILAGTAPLASARLVSLCSSSWSPCCCSWWLAPRFWVCSRSTRPYFTRQQNLAGLNIAMQDAVAQMQLDLGNAGTGYYPGALISSWPIGVTINNQPSGAGACNDATTFTYTAACFDTLNILSINQNVSPAHPTNATGGTASTICSNITSSPFYIQPMAGQTPAQTAANFTTGDQVLLITTGGGTHGVTGPTGGNSASASSGTLVNSFRVDRRRHGRRELCRIPVHSGRELSAV